MDRWLEGRDLPAIEDDITACSRLVLVDEHRMERATANESHCTCDDVERAQSMHAFDCPLAERPDFECLLCNTTEPDSELINGCPFCFACINRLQRVGVLDERCDFISETVGSE